MLIYIIRKLTSIVKAKILKVKLQKILVDDNACDIIYKINFKDVKFQIINQSAHKIIGCDQHQAIELESLFVEAKLYNDKSLSSFQTFKTLSELYSHLTTINNNKFEIDYKLCSKEGCIIWLNDVCYPIYDSAHNITGLTGIMRNITSRIQNNLDLENALLKLAYTDPLTELDNRRYFFDQLDLEMKYASSKNDKLSILLIDIDYFKKINDDYGHFIGDQVLIKIGKLIKQILRESGVVARLGGEEFGVILPDISLKKAHLIAEQICNLIANQTFKFNNLPIFRCTVSIGVACNKTSKFSKMIDLYKLADYRLYIAKNTGRNQVSIDQMVEEKILIH